MKSLTHFEVSNLSYYQLGPYLTSILMQNALSSSSLILYYIVLLRISVMRILSERKAVWFGGCFALLSLASDLFWGENTVPMIYFSSKSVLPQVLTWVILASFSGGFLTALGPASVLRNSSPWHCMKSCLNRAQTGFLVRLIFGFVIGPPFHIGSLDLIDFCSDRNK